MMILSRAFFKWIYNRLAPALLAIATLAGLYVLGQQAERPAYDLLSWLSARQVQDSPVTLVLIDDDSLERLRERFGPLPWPRKTYLEVFERIAQLDPALMVFDGHFMNINGAEDAEVFTAMGRFPHLITGLVKDEVGGRELARLNTAMPQYYQLNLGVVSIQEDPDGSIRSLKPVYQVHTGKNQIGVFHALAVAAAHDYLHVKHPGSIWITDIQEHLFQRSLRIFPEHNPASGINIPLSKHDAFYMRWYRPLRTERPEYQRSHQAVSLWQLFDPQQPSPDLKGRIALIGASATFYRDYNPTPMARQHLGPDIHATAIDNLLQQDVIRKAPRWVNLLVLMGLILLSIILRLRLSLAKTLLYTLGTMLIYLAMAVGLLSYAGWWLDVVTPELFMLVAFLAGSTVRIMTREKQLAAMSKNLSQLVDPEVFREIQRLSHVLQPGGHKQEITSMFVDIRNFTTLAERLQPAEVTALLNEFYGDIVDVVFRHQGTIDKFMGDGILIIFGAPLPQEHHRALALAAAQDVLQATERLSSRWLEREGIRTEIGISLNSGPAFVGFFGPPDKLEYTGVGDTVNISVRLQEHNKRFNTRLVFTESTLQGVPERLAHQIPPEQYIPLGDVTVRGREGSIRIYTLAQAILPPGTTPA